MTILAHSTLNRLRSLHCVHRVWYRAFLGCARRAVGMQTGSEVDSGVSQTATGNHGWWVQWDGFQDSAFGTATTRQAPFTPGGTGTLRCYRAGPGSKKCTGVDPAALPTMFCTKGGVDLSPVRPSPKGQRNLQFGWYAWMGRTGGEDFWHGGHLWVPH